MSNKTEFDFTLETPIKYEKGGGQAEAFTLILKAPSNPQRTHRIKLKEYILAASSWNEQKLLGALDLSNPDVLAAFSKIDDDAKEKGDNDGNDNGKALVESMYACKDINMCAVIEEFLLLLLEVCTVEGEKKLTKPLFNKMSPDDTDRLMGEYFQNFISGS